MIIVFSWTSSFSPPPAFSYDIVIENMEVFSCIFSLCFSCLIRFWICKCFCMAYADAYTWFNILVWNNSELHHDKFSWHFLFLHNLLSLWCSPWNESILLLHWNLLAGIGSRIGYVLVDKCTSPRRLSIYCVSKLARNY
jgi:hypothetical protein